MSEKILSIEWARGLAALMIVIWHSPLSIKAFKVNYLFPDNSFQNSAFPWSRFDIGVDIFFVISGFVMAMISHREQKKSEVKPLRFIAHRAIRVFPMYWLCTLMVILGYVISPAWNLGHFTGKLTDNLPRIFESMFLIPQSEAPILGVGWTLVFEMLFYYIVAVVNFIRPSALFKTLGFIAFTALIQEIFQLSFFFNHIFSHYFILFFAGSMLFKFSDQLTAKNPWFLLSVSLVVFTSLFIGLESVERNCVTYHVVRTCGIAIALPFLLAYCIKYEVKFLQCLPHTARFLSWLGVSSYSLYLTHWFILSMMGKAASRIYDSSLITCITWQITSISVCVCVWVLLCASILRSL